MREEFGNICRAVWNTALEQRREYRGRVREGLPRGLRAGRRTGPDVPRRAGCGRYAGGVVL